MQACRNANITLPHAAEAELKKRIKAPAKAKLDLFKCGLDDRMVTLSEAPVISKLDLGGNYTSDQSAICLIRLLILQAKQVRDTPIDQRLTAVYMGEVSFDQSKSIIQDKIIEDIAVVCGALRHANVKTRIRECFIRTAGTNGVILNSATMDRLYLDVTGKKSDKVFLHKCDAALIASGQRSLTFAEVDKLIISDLVDQGSLPLLSAKQEKLITEGMAGPGKKTSAAGSGSATPQKQEQPTPTAAPTPPPPPSSSSSKGPDPSLSTNQQSTPDVPETQQQQQPKKVQVKIRTPNRSMGGIAKNAPASTDGSRRLSEKSSEPNSAGISTVPSRNDSRNDSRSESPRGRPPDADTVAAQTVLTPNPPPATINTSSSGPSAKQPIENARASKVNSLLTKINSSKSLVTAKSPSTDLTISTGAAEGEEMVSPTREETQAMANEFQAKLDESRRHTATTAPSQRLEPHDHRDSHNSNQHGGTSMQPTTLKSGHAPALDDFVSTPKKEEQTPTSNKLNLPEKYKDEEAAVSTATTATATVTAAGDRRPASRPRAKVVMKQRATSADKAAPEPDNSNNNNNNSNNNNNNNNNNEDIEQQSVSLVSTQSNQELPDMNDEAAVASTIVKLEVELLTQERKIAKLEDVLVSQGVIIPHRVADTIDDEEMGDKKHTRSPSHAPRDDDVDVDADDGYDVRPSPAPSLTATMPTATATIPTTIPPTTTTPDIVAPATNNEPEPPVEDTKESKVSALRARLQARKKVASGGGSVDKDMNLLSASGGGGGGGGGGNNHMSDVVVLAMNQREQSANNDVDVHPSVPSAVSSSSLPQSTPQITEDSSVSRSIETTLPPTAINNHETVNREIVKHEVVNRPERTVEERPEVEEYDTTTTTGPTDGFPDQESFFPSTRESATIPTTSNNATAATAGTTRAQITAQLGRPPVIVKPMVPSKSSSQGPTKSPTNGVEKMKAAALAAVAAKRMTSSLSSSSSSSLSPQAGATTSNRSANATTTAATMMTRPLEKKKSPPKPAMVKIIQF